MCVWTFAVELEAGQLGVDAHRNGSDLVEGGAQCLLIAHWDLLVTFTGGGHALRTVLARLVLDTQKTTTTTTRFSLKLREWTGQDRQNWPKVKTTFMEDNHSALNKLIAFVRLM